MQEIEVTKEDLGGGQGRYVARIDGNNAEAELVFITRGANLISADHTFAPPVLRGTGAAFALVQAMVDDARKNGFKVIPRCSYVVAQAEKHPDWADAFVAG
ncbi:N-acetyltransferase [Paracoccus sp. 11-3]|uniref:N-acetyltransferase n=1 Tax=Paracoccus amoyensis TaxID=2760093 RepID=A0A926GQ80_9RHOB|nr:GNAT family N-acetyltransferase [Paracoccus amoyensis]MBC9247955.1 N-acetyltransferase [Paracoccus amoyensis]